MRQRYSGNQETLEQLHSKRASDTGTTPNYSCVRRMKSPSTMGSRTDDSQIEKLKQKLEDAKQQFMTNLQTEDESSYAYETLRIGANRTRDPTPLGATERHDLGSTRGNFFNGSKSGLRHKHQQSESILPVSMAATLTNKALTASNRLMADEIGDKNSMIQTLKADMASILNSFKGFYWFLEDVRRMLEGVVASGFILTKEAATDNLMILRRLDENMRSVVQTFDPDNFISKKAKENVTPYSQYATDGPNSKLRRELVAPAEVGDYFANELRYMKILEGYKSKLSACDAGKAELSYSLSQLSKLREESAKHQEECQRLRQSKDAQDREMREMKALLQAVKADFAGVTSELLKSSNDSQLEMKQLKAESDSRLTALQRVEKQSGDSLQALERRLNEENARKMRVVVEEMEAAQRSVTAKLHFSEVERSKIEEQLQVFKQLYHQEKSEVIELERNILSVQKERDEIQKCLLEERKQSDVLKEMLSSYEKKHSENKIKGVEFSILIQELESNIKRKEMEKEETLMVNKMLTAERENLISQIAQKDACSSAAILPKAKLVFERIRLVLLEPSYFSTLSEEQIQELRLYLSEKGVKKLQSVQETEARVSRLQEQLDHGKSDSDVVLSKGLGHMQDFLDFLNDMSQTIAKQGQQALKDWFTSRRQLARMKMLDLSNDICELKVRFMESRNGRLPSKGTNWREVPSEREQNLLITEESPRRDDLQNSEKLVDLEMVLVAQAHILEEMILAK